MARPYDDGRSPTRVASGYGRSPDKGGNSIVTLPPERLYERRHAGLISTDAADPDALDTLKGKDTDDQQENDQDILALARSRFQASYNNESTLRTEMVQDQRFYNGEQWPDQIKADRTNDKRP